MSKFLFSLIPASAIVVASGVAALWWSIPWWIVLVLVLITFYLSLTAGIASERSRLPSVSVGPLALEANFFHIRVTSMSTIPVKPRVWVTRVVDANEKMLTRRSHECHWRDKDFNFVMELDGVGVEATAGVLGIGDYGGNPFLYLLELDSKQFFLNHDVPWNQQLPVTFSVLATCESKGGEKGESVAQSFTVVPDYASSSKYSVLQPTSQAKRASIWPRLYRHLLYVLRGNRRRRRRRRAGALDSTTLT